MLTFIIAALGGAGAMAAAVRYVRPVRERIVRAEDGPKPGLPK